ncbi:DcuC family C4-dicarboxylate transporter [Symbiobacterium terraclitae]|uniref:DcuC family C4-dicarboxylate transporter n=1 Tax=Symbiobacterium terraclitae TaxID=557451 RepID=A0ABS4JR86_9FIRM|nr:C4-dicarboxylate transporter DcuC [Symbiobacterium terraclitae]MBP2016954.1 DcuC family C4-dicarboxylate transporter [Symbiobacterium terraclitae]
MLPWIGILIVLATIYAIIKRYETRLVLFTAGLLMATISLKPMAAFEQFTKSMTNAGLITAICSVMGFAYVMKLTKCDQHLVHLVAGGVTKLRAILIPASTMATFLINIALPSAAGCSAAVGAVLIPVMMAAGIHPAVAAAAVLAGTFGSVLSPGSAHIVMVSDMSGLSVVETIAVITAATVVAGLIGAIALAVYAFIRKEDRGYQPQDLGSGAEFKVNFLYAMVPVIPLVLLILGATVPAMKDWGLTVAACMVIGTILALVVTRTSPAEVSKSFFDGMGKAYGDVIGIIIAAGVFAAGLGQIGLIDMLINAVTGVQGAVAAAGTWGPMLVAILSGSGDAATIAFNEAVTPHAATFGMEMAPLGTLASLAGSLGRSMSPVAGAAIVVSGIAGVNPIEVAKRNAPGMILASIVAFVMMGL